MITATGIDILPTKAPRSPTWPKPTNNPEVRVRGQDLNQFINTMTLVATILATVTFAAAFTMPGGFDTRPDNLGVAILVKKASLKVFILADSIAMCCSMAVMFLLMWAMIAEKDDVTQLANVSSLLLQFAFFATLVAFMSVPVFFYSLEYFSCFGKSQEFFSRYYADAGKKGGNGVNFNPKTGLRKRLVTPQLARYGMLISEGMTS
ncbi:hypothetical protein Vadar_013020 [Vaccinium darrowii]|uniref:Uncharacterized protein n=1 Tax=Vaccinium darrowii TaxID=229202 RepID=A0ACB7XQE5_9ERIC|nr:hypothetical protein Vadar_013020 [Vaccinium darrowii]